MKPSFCHSCTVSFDLIDVDDRSLNSCVETGEDLKGKKINLISLKKRIDTTSAAGGCKILEHLQTGWCPMSLEPIRNSSVG